MAKDNDKKRTAGGKGKPESPLITDYDIHLFNEGNHFRLYEKLGAHPMIQDGVRGTHFAVWAPAAKQVSVIGNFNGWDKTSHPLDQLSDSGIWFGFISNVAMGEIYKFHILSEHHGYQVNKADPFAFWSELSPKTASVVWELDHAWGDKGWMENRKSRTMHDAPISIYEVHLGSWRRPADKEFLSYREIAPLLMAHVNEMGFTHVELLPVMEHPFYGSWGYQTTGYFAATSRYGAPQDLMYLIDQLHQNGIGVILDWVPSHFPRDEHGLGFFDGSFLYEHADPRKGYHPDWESSIFNYGRGEVRSFLISSALFWLEKYHADALRVDAVASMLYLDYSRDEGQWLPNKYGGRENLEAIDFLKQFNVEVYEQFPDAHTVAEESTAWPMVSRPTDAGGLGFGMKWDMGWMHDILEYMQMDPIHRRHHHNLLTFRMLYAFSENFILPFSHDEVVHMKGSMLGKMPGDEWQRFANLRLLLGFMYAQAGKKLLFMGAEFGQQREWNHDSSLDWGLVEEESHSGLMKYVRDLNRLYRGNPALYENDFDPSGFEWINADDRDNSAVSFLRKGRNEEEQVLVVGGFTPVPREEYRIGVPRPGAWKVLLNSDEDGYWGSGVSYPDVVESSAEPMHGHGQSIEVILPPLGLLFLGKA